MVISFVFKEAENTVNATTFTWDIFLFGAEARAASNINLSGLDDFNDFSSPDGMWFDPRGVCGFKQMIVSTLMKPTA